MQVNSISSAGSFSALYSIAGKISASNAKAKIAMTNIAKGTTSAIPSDLAMSERLRGMILRSDAAISNMENAVSYSDVSDGYLQNIQDNVARMQELAISANDGTKTDTDRQALQAEFSQLKDSLGSVASGSSPLASFNGQALFDGKSVTTAIGPEPGQTMDFSAIDLTNSSQQVVGKDSSGSDIKWGEMISGAGSLDISSQGGAQSAVSALSQASDMLSGIRATRGAEKSRIESSLTGMRDSQMNTIASESRIRDVDVAKEMINLVKFMTLGKTGSAMLKSAHGSILATA